MESNDFSTMVELGWKRKGTETFEVTNSGLTEDGRRLWMDLKFSGGSRMYVMLDSLDYYIIG